MEWIQLDDAILLHRKGVELTGEPNDIRSPGLLESALDAPRNKYLYEECSDVGELASLYALRISANQPFVNGNKRAGWLCARAFCVMNGYDVVVSETFAETTQIVVERITMVAEDAESEQDFALWFASCVY